MANQLYPSGRTAIDAATISLTADTIKVVGLTSGYSYNSAHDNLDDISGAYRVGTPEALTNKTYSAGVFNADDATVENSSSSTVTQIVVYKEGASDAASPLIAHIDTATGLPFSTGGIAYTLTWAAAGIFEGTGSIGARTYLGNNSSTTSASTVTMTLTGAVTAGDSIVVSCEVDSATRTITSVIDSAGNTYAVDIDRNHASAGRHLYIFSCHNALALSVGQSITANLSTVATSRRAIEAFTISGLKDTGAFDKSSSNEGTGTALTTGSSGTLSQAAELVVGAFLTASTSAFTMGSGWSGQGAFLTGAGRLATEIKTVSATTAQDADATCGSAAWVAVLASYRAELTTGGSVATPTIAGYVAPVPPSAGGFNEAEAFALSLVIELSDGRTQRWGPDELDAADVPTGLRFGTSMPGGFRDLACSLLRRIDVDRPDEQTFATVTVYDIAGAIVWRGRFRQFPRKHGNEYTVEPGAEGWIAHLTDRKDARALYRDIDLTRWEPQPCVQRRINLATSYTFTDPQLRGDVTTGAPALVTTVNGDWTATVLPISEAIYNALGLPIGSVYYAWKKNANAGSGATSWSWSVFLANEDTLATIDTSGDLEAAGPGSGTLTATSTARRFAAVQLTYGAGPVTTKLDYEVNWTTLAVHGDHGLTLRGTEPNAGFYISDLVEHAVQTWAPKLNVDDIETNTVVVPHVTFLDPTDAGTMVQTFNRAALWDYGVYGRERFFFRQSDPDRLTWKLRLDKGTTLHFDGATGDEIINGVCVFYPDPSGRMRSVGPVGALVDTEDSSLSSDDPSNPANKYGLTKHDSIQLSDPCVEETAILIGQLYLAQRSIPQRRGEVTVSGMTAIHPRKGPRPSFEIWAGDYVQIVDSNDDLLGAPRRVVDTDYEHDTRSNQLTLDNRPDTVESLLALLGAELIGRA